MSKSINLVALLSVTGGLAAATLPNTARANCSPSGTSGGGSYAASGAPTGASGPSIDPQKRYEQGLAAYGEGRYREAGRAFEDVIPYSSQPALLYYYTGASRLRLGDTKGARRMLERAVKLAPDFLIAQQDLGVAYAKLGDRPKAEAVLAKMKAQADQCAGKCEEAEPLLAVVTTIGEAMAAMPA